MSNLTIENKDGQLVVDSRLIAQELGIEHKTLKDTIKSYEEELTIGLNTKLRRETLKGKSLPQGGFGTGEIVYWLTEDQATFVMMARRNTEQVVNAKLRLANAFSKAKGALQSINPELLSLLFTMTEKRNILTTRTERLDNIDNSMIKHKGIKGVVNTEVEDCYPPELEYTTREYLEWKQVNVSHLNTLRKRAIVFYRQGTKQEELPKKGSEVVFKGNNISYLDQALKTVLGLD